MPLDQDRSLASSSVCRGLAALLSACTSAPWYTAHTEGDMGRVVKWPLTETADE